MARTIIYNHTEKDSLGNLIKCSCRFCQVSKNVYGVHMIYDDATKERFFLCEKHLLNYSLNNDCIVYDIEDYRKIKPLTGKLETDNEVADRTGVSC